MCKISTVLTVLWHVCEKIYLHETQQHHIKRSMLVPKIDRQRIILRNSVLPHTHTHTHTQRYVCIKCMHTHTHTHTHTHIYRYIKCMHTRTHIHRHICKCMHTHTHTHTYTHTNTQQWEIASLASKLFVISGPRWLCHVISGPSCDIRTSCTCSSSNSVYYLCKYPHYLYA